METAPTPLPVPSAGGDFEGQPAVTWPAVFAGAVVGLAIALMLTALGAGFGWRLSSAWAGSPGEGFTTEVGVWLVATQVIAGGLGGYIAGRLRTKWRNVHGHEVHFRDTAHGLIAWAVATIAGFVLAGLTPGSPPGSPMAGVSPDQANQFSLFLAFGLLLGAFISAVAAALGGLRRDEMHAKFWKER